MSKRNKMYRNQTKTKVLLAALNVPGYYSLPVRIFYLLAKQSHGLAARFDVDFAEADINEGLCGITEKIISSAPDILGISVNVWNRNFSFELCEKIKTYLPDTVILAGGQEITNSCIDYPTQVSCIDYFIDGEGEIPFVQFLSHWDENRKKPDHNKVSGLWYRENGSTVLSFPAETLDSLDALPSPILSDIVPFGPDQKLGVLLEGARSCPYKCAFCFEGAKKEKVRFVSIERLKAEIDYMAAKGADYFHIMDPILCQGSTGRLRDLTEHIGSLKKSGKKAVFSVEVYAEHVTGGVAECLRACAIIDIGVQSANRETLISINRKFQPDRFDRGIENLQKAGVPFNLYLICGLPRETLETYVAGIEFIISKNPVRIFLNELCLLNGTELRQRAEEYGYLFDPDPPYLVKQSRWMSEREIKFANALSKAVERQYNLSASAVYTNAPWVDPCPGQARIDLDIPFPGECDCACDGCAAADAEVPDVNAISGPVAEATIKVPGKVKPESLVALIGQLRLAGAERISIAAPPEFFRQSELLRNLIKMGVWKFKTFYQVPGQSKKIQKPGINEEPEAIDAAVYNINKKYSLRGRADIHPILEIMVFADNPYTTAYTDAVKRFLSQKVPIVHVPYNGSGKSGQLESSLAGLMRSGISPRSWLKAPENIVRMALAEIGAGANIVSGMQRLDLLSDEPTRPPCFYSPAAANRSCKL